MFPDTSVQCSYRDQDIYESWLRFLLDREFALRRMAAIDTPPAFRRNDDIGDAIIASLMYVRAVAILDEAFVSYIDAEWTPPPKLKALATRIDYLKSRGRLSAPADVERAKDTRNGLAHESDKTCTWSDLTSVVDVVDSELQHLGFAGPRPTTNTRVERRPRETPEPNALVTHDYTFSVTLEGVTGLTINGREVGTIVSSRAWSINLMLPSRTD